MTFLTIFSRLLHLYQILGLMKYCLHLVSFSMKLVFVSFLSTLDFTSSDVTSIPEG